MAKRIKKKGQAMIYKAPQIKLRIEQQELH